MLDELHHKVDQLENYWSRFKSTSELMLANNAHGNVQHVSPDTIRLIQEMQFGYRLTNGVFNPGQLHATIEHGCAQSKVDSLDTSVLSNGNIQVLTVLDVVVNADESTIVIPKGLALDAGGIGKGLAADITADLAIQLGAQGTAVFIGGEVCVRGIAPGDQGWTIGVSSPQNPSIYLDVLALHDGGVATSGPRGWTNIRGESHIIDPRTNQPAQCSIAQATVVASTSTHAEVLTKLCMLLPIDDALSEIERLGADALLVDDKLNRYETVGWENFV